MNKRWTIGPIVMVLAILTLCSSFVWVTNLISAIPRWRLFELGAVGELIKKLQQIAPFQWLSSIYIVTVDLSTVTTAVIMLTLLYATLGMRKVYIVIKGKEEIAGLRTEHFPFESTYQTFYVYMGLLGTLWGFIIAFRKTSPDDPKILLLALGTALWSTFSAIILAFLVCPVFEKLFRYIINSIPNSVSPDPDKDDIASDIAATADAFANLSHKVNGAKKALEKFTGKINYWEFLQEIQGKLTSIEKELEKLLNEKISIIPQIEATCEDIKNTILTMDNRLRKVEEEIEEVKKAKKAISKIRDLLSDLA